jgi:tetratricopeptide (TPR) repeat protein
MQRAEAMMQPHPDSALAILASMTPPPTAQRFQFEAWKVLLVQARDRNYLPITPYERAIRRSVTYFDSIATDATSLRAKAHYYLGRIYQDKGDDVNTVREFLTAEPLAEEAKDTTMMINAKSNIGYALWNNNFLQSADSIYRQVIPLEEKKHDWEGLAIAFNKIGDTCIQKGPSKYKEAKTLLLHALYAVNKTDNIYIKFNILSSLGILHLYLMKYQDVLRYANECAALNPNEPISDETSLLKGCAYAGLMKTDSAIIYLKRCLKSDNRYTVYGAYSQLAELSRKAGENKLALFYTDKYIQYKDSAQHNTQSEKVITDLKDILSRQSVVHYSLSLSLYQTFILLFVIILLGLCIYILIKRPQRIELEKYKESHKPSLRDVFENDPCFKIVMDNLEYNKSYVGKNKLSKDSWDEIKTTIMKFSPCFFDRLLTRYPMLTKVDIRFCCLSILDFPMRDFQYICGCSYQAIYKQQDSVFDKIPVKNQGDLKKILIKMLH